MRRIVTSYSLHRSASGRLSSGVDSSEPDKLRGKVTQVQNIPKGVRDIVVAPPGYTLIQGDWAGIEWAIAMWMASKYDDDTFHLDLLDKFQAGNFDPHIYLASFANGVPESEVTPVMRKEAKPYTHGRTYLGSHRVLARNAGHKDAIGEKVCNAHEKAFKLGVWQAEVIANAKHNHYVQTPLGWRRYFWENQKNSPELAAKFGLWTPKPQEVIATLVSGTAADLCKVILNDIFLELPSGWEVLTTTHDSVLIMVPGRGDEVWNHMMWLRGKMSQPIPWLDGRGWKADVRSDINWKDVS